MSKLNNEGMAAIGGFFFILLVIALWCGLFALGGYCFDYSLASITGRDVPWYADVIGGIVTSAFLLVVTVICWILRLAGYETPFIS